MDDFGETGWPVPSHFGVLIYLGDAAGAGTRGEGRQIRCIAAGDESTCWAAIEQWTATHRLRAGEHAEVLARTSATRGVADPRGWVADERDRIADERDWIANAREDTADRREAAADERERDLDRRQDVLSELVQATQGESGAVMTRARELLGDAQARLDRSKAAVERSRAKARRAIARARFEQAAIDRQVAATRRDAAIPDHSQPTLEVVDCSARDPAGHAPSHLTDDAS